ncbi:MAG: hypothetical protein M1326_10295 [Cyanobacteria bacterium]|nr:hypothetical protein [Cyanobacteriota bacterium]
MAVSAAVVAVVVAVSAVVAVVAEVVSTDVVFTAAVVLQPAKEKAVIIKTLNTITTIQVIDFFIFLSSHFLL